MFTDKEIIYFILSLLSIILSFVLLRKRKVNQFRMKFIDIYLILLAIVMVMMITVRLIRKDMDIESELLLLCFFITYFLVRSINSGYKYYLSLLMISAAFLYAGMIKYCLTGTESLFGVEAMLRQPEGTATWLILACCISILLYSKEVKKSWNIFYLFMSAAGFLLLFLYGDMIAACIVWIIILKMCIRDSSKEFADKIQIKLYAAGRLNIAEGFNLAIKSSSEEIIGITAVSYTHLDKLRRLEAYLSTKAEEKDATSIGILLSGCCGLRIGELCALQWKNINWEEGTIQIRGTIDVYKRQTTACVHLRESA